MPQETKDGPQIKDKSRQVLECMTHRICAAQMVCLNQKCEGSPLLLDVRTPTNQSTIPTSSG